MRLLCRGFVRIAIARTMTAASGLERAAGELVDLVDRAHFKQLKPQDYPGLIEIRDECSRMVESIDAAKGQLVRVDELRAQQVRRLVSEGNYGSLDNRDQLVLYNLRAEYSSRWQAVQAAIERCPTTCPAADPLGGDGVTESTKAVNDLGPGDDVDEAGEVSAATHRAACLVLGAAGAGSLASAYILYRSIVWTGKVLFG